MPLKTQKLRSTALIQASYNTDTETLTLWFANGQSYDYPAVPEDIYDGLTTANSPGSYYSTFIKDQF